MYPSIASGNITMFYQASAPVGWTKITTYNDYALRIVTGTAGSGGSVSFSTCFSPITVSGSVSVSASVGAYTLTTSDIPSHYHPAGATASPTSVTRGNSTPLGNYPSMIYPVLAGPFGYSPAVTGAGGSGYSHTHPSSSSGGTLSGSNVAMSINYADVILAQRN